MNTRKKKIRFAGGAMVFFLAIVFWFCLGCSGASKAEQQEQTIRGQAVTVTTTPAITETPEKKVAVAWGKKTASIKAGKKYTFQIKADGANVPAAGVTWSVSNKKYATITKKGVLKGKRMGTVTVKAKYAGTTLTCKVKIKPKRIIGIDAGHQASANSGLEPMGPGSSTMKAKVAGGTCGVSSRVPEYQFTLKVAKALKKELVSRGYQVVMTRTKNNVNISNKERAVKINKSGADICIRLHGDGGSSSAKGASALYPSAGNPYVGKLSKKSLKLSKCIMTTYCKETGINNRGCIQRDDLTGTNWSTVPVTLIELGFMTNPSEDLYMQSASGQKSMVKGLADGIDNYFGY